MSQNQQIPGRNSPPGTPTWVKVIVIIFIVLVAIVVILHLLGFGFGGHGVATNTAIIISGTLTFQYP